MMFERLFSPLTIRSMRLKNRLVMPPMATNFGTREGFVTEKLKQHYAARARGGIGLIIVESSGVDDPVGVALRNNPGLYDAKFEPGLRDLVACIHEQGAKVAYQVNHGGKRATRENTGLQPVAPSPLPIRARPPDWPGNEVPHELTLEEIRRIVGHFASAAARAQRVGADAIEIHGAHGYLVSEFLSRYDNIRTDEYGGSLENRARFALEVVRAVRKAVGDSFPISFRLCADEFVEGGITPEEACLTAKMLEKAGVDVFNVSAGTFNTIEMTIAPQSQPPGYLVPLAERVKRSVSVPVIAVGRINSPEIAEKALAEGKADLVAVGRALWADPEFPNKAREGRTAEIRRCIACNQGCIGRLRQYDASGSGMTTCSLNAQAGNEVPLLPAREPKKVVVVGGGPAGMEASRVAALRGHSVTLIEEDSRLGGQLLLAKVPPYKSEIENVITYYESELRRLHVEVRLGTRADVLLLRRLKPQAIALATGAMPLAPDAMPAGGGRVVTAWDVLRGDARVVGPAVVVGGGMVGCETAEYLAERGLRVTILEMLPDIGADIPTISRYLIRQRLAGHDVKVACGACVKAIEETEVTLEGGVRVPAATVVLAVGARSNRSLAEDLAGEGLPVYPAGDCVQPGNLLQAIHQGFNIGLGI